MEVVLYFILLNYEDVIIFCGGIEKFLEEFSVAMSSCFIASDTNGPNNRKKKNVFKNVFDFFDIFRILLEVRLNLSGDQLQATPNEVHFAFMDLEFGVSESVSKSIVDELNEGFLPFRAHFR